MVRLNCHSKMNKGLLDEIIQLISTHTEHDGSYCDTGEDMGWACRSECMEKALKRLDELTKNLITD